MSETLMTPGVDHHDENLIRRLAHESRRRPQAEGVRNNGMVRLYVWSSMAFVKWLVKNNLAPKSTNSLYYADPRFFQSHCRSYVRGSFLVELFWIDVPVFPALLQAIGELNRSHTKYRMKVYA